MRHTTSKSALSALLVLALALGAAPLAAQARVGADSATRLTRYGRDLLYGTALGLVWAGVDQWRNDPPEWPSDGSGYAKRAASDIGEFVVQETTTDLLAAALDRPLDYQRCTCREVGGRIGWALSNALTDPMPGGKRLLAIPRIVGAYAGSFAQASWRPAPKSGSRVTTAVINGSVSLLIGAGINLWYEFRP